MRQTALPDPVSPLAGVDARDLAAIDAHLRETYTGVFRESDFARFVPNYIGPILAREQLRQVTEHDPGVRTLLDVGCGFGAFVLEARQAGIDARGVDVSDFDVGIAARRLGRLRPSDRTAYVRGSAFSLPFAANSFDAVTLWNVLEHVPDCGPVLREAARVLRPSGTMHIRCPNYLAVRLEPHYYVLWPSLIPRSLASVYLRWRGKDPRFFEQQVFYRTNREVLHILEAAGLTVSFPPLAKLDSPDDIRNPRVRSIVKLLARVHAARLVRRVARAMCRGPFKSRIAVTATKSPAGASPS